MIKRISTSFFCRPRNRNGNQASTTPSPRFHLVGFLALMLVSQIALADQVHILEKPDEAAQARIDLIQQARSSIDA